MFNKFLAWVERLFNSHMFVRRSVVFWSIGLITFTIMEFFIQLPSVGTAQASVIIAVIGILATAIGFYQANRQKEEQ